MSSSRPPRCAHRVQDLNRRTSSQLNTTRVDIRPGRTASCRAAHEGPTRPTRRCNAAPPRRPRSLPLVSSARRTHQPSSPAPSWSTSTLCIKAPTLVTRTNPRPFSRAIERIDTCRAYVAARPATVPARRGAIGPRRPRREPRRARPPVNHGAPLPPKGDVAVLSRRRHPAAAGVASPLRSTSAILEQADIEPTHHHSSRYQSWSIPVHRQQVSGPGGTRQDRGPR
jgi:hypothetical protein